MPENYQKKANYLVCVNNQPYSKVVLDFAASIARKNNGSILILHVTEPSDYQSVGAVADKMSEESRQEAEKLLQNLAEKVSARFNITPVLIVREGLIEHEIIKVMDEDPSINMLILGSASESSPKSKVAQPLVSKVGRKLSVPILIVPGNLSDEQIRALT